MFFLMEIAISSRKLKKNFFQQIRVIRPNKLNTRKKKNHSESVSPETKTPKYFFKTLVIFLTVVRFVEVDISPQKTSFSRFLGHGRSTGNVSFLGEVLFGREVGRGVKVK